MAVVLLLRLSGAALLVLVPLAIRVGLHLAGPFDGEHRPGGGEEGW